MVFKTKRKISSMIMVELVPQQSNTQGWNYYTNWESATKIILKK